MRYRIVVGVVVIEVVCLRLVDVVFMVYVGVIWINSYLI